MHADTKFTKAACPIVKPEFTSTAKSPVTKKKTKENVYTL